MLASCLLIISCDKAPQLGTEIEETFYVRNDGADMPVFMRGNLSAKKVILLLHGGPGDSSVAYMVKNFSQQLQKDYAFAFWDQRQQGNSHGSFNKEVLSLETMVEDVDAVVKSLKLRYGSDFQIYIMGHSWGGSLGTAYLQTSDYQNQISGFIEISGAYDFPMVNREVVKMMNEYGQIEIDNDRNTTRWTEILNFANQLDLENITLDEMLELNGYAGDIRREELLEDLYKIPSSVNIEEGSDYVSNEISVTMNAISIFTQKDLIEDALNVSMKDQLGKITIPTLLVWGKYDFKVPPFLGEFAFENLGSIDKTLKIYEHSGHSSMTYDPDRFVQDVKDFME